MNERFSGLGLHLGNLSRLSEAKSRSISAENPTGEKGKGGMAEDGTGAIHARGLGRGWKISPSRRVAPGETLAPRRDRRRRSDPADLDHAGERALARPDPAHLLGRPGPSVCRDAARRFLCLRLGALCAGEFARRLRQSGPGLQLLLGDAVPPPRADHAREPGSRVGGGHLLADQLRPDRRSGGRRLFSRAVSPRQSAAVQAGSTSCSTARAVGVITSGPMSPGASTIPAGGARARSSSFSTATIGRRSAAPAPRTTSAAPTISTPGRSIRRFRAPMSNSRRPIRACRR